MIPSKFVIILRAATVAGICAALASAGDSRAYPTTSPTTLVVKTDAHSGRLVRSAVVGATVGGGKATAPAPAKDLKELIDAVAAKHDVEALLVHSVIQAESNYDPLALSPKGAQGLMQLIPATARRFGVENSFDPQQNVEGGVKYLKFLMKLYQNDYVKVIAAYNAGEAAVAKYSGIPPYVETRNYVRQVGLNLVSARQVAELKAAEAKKDPPAPAETVSSEPTVRSIVAVTRDDGRIYYKTQ